MLAIFHLHQQFIDAQIQIIFYLTQAIGVTTKLERLKYFLIKSFVASAHHLLSVSLQPLLSSCSWHTLDTFAKLTSSANIRKLQQNICNLSSQFKMKRNIMCPTLWSILNQSISNTRRLALRFIYNLSSNLLKA